MAIEHQNIYRQVYNVREDEQLLAGLHHVTCIFARRAVLAIGYDANNELLSLHYAGYGKERPVWELGFFEQLFHQEPLLVQHDKISNVFVLTSSEMLVPDALYNKDAAEQWFKSIHFTERNDVITHYAAAAHKAMYLYTIPHGINELIRISCHSAVVRPLAAGQLGNAAPLQCVLTGEQACVTLQNNGKLLWHKVFDYAQAEDVAYEIKLLCKEHNINSDKITIACGSISTTEYAAVNGLSQYFGGITGSDGQYIKSLWGPTLSMVKQLEACA